MVIRELFVKLGVLYDDKAIKAIDRDLKDLQAVSRETMQGLKGVADSMIGAGKKLSLFVSAPLAAISGLSLKAAGDMEQLNIAFASFLGSQGAATKFMVQVQRFAEQTSFEFPELIDYAKLMMGARIESEKIIPTMRMLGDIASKVGKDKLPGMVRALIDTKNKTKLTGEEVRQYTNAGVAIIPLLADAHKKTSAQIMEDMERGKISYEMLVKALEVATAKGGHFYKGLAAQEGTLNQVLSNLSESTFFFRAELGKLLMESLPIKATINWLIKGLRSVVNVLKNLPKPLKMLTAGIILFGIALGPMLIAFGAFLKLLIGIKIALLLFNLTAATSIPAIAGMGAALWAALAPVLPIVIAIAAGVAALYLVIDDVVAFFQGRKSVLGVFVNKMKEAGGGLFWIFKDIKEMLKDLFRLDFTALDQDLKLILKTWEIFFGDLWDMFSRSPVAGMLRALGIMGQQQIGVAGFSTGGSGASAAALGPSILPGRSPISISSGVTINMPPGTQPSDASAISGRVEKAVEEGILRALRNAGAVTDTSELSGHRSGSRGTSRSF